MQKSISDYIVILISVVGSIASVIGVLLYFKGTINEQGWVGIAFLGILALFFLIYCWYLISKYRIIVRYADVFEDINIGFAELHKIHRQGINDIAEMMNKISSATEYISNAFSRLYGHHISVCIKLIVFKDNRALASTLSRDKKSIAKNRRVGGNDKGEHWIDKNSDFNFIYSNYDSDDHDTSFYHETRLPIRKRYYNSRLKNWPPPGNIIGGFLEKTMLRKSWPLKYRSTLVVPIVPLFSEEQNQKAVRGFLCLDSPREVCFNTQYDVEILKGIADGIYNIIDKLQEQSKKINEYERASENS